MAANVSPSPEAGGAAPAVTRNVILLAAGLVVCILLHSSIAFQLWYPLLGLGLALTSWCGYRFAAALALGLWAHDALSLADSALPGWFIAADRMVFGLEIAGAWWLYIRSGGSPRIDDPRSAVLFLILVPGTAAALGAIAHILLASLAVATESGATLAQEIGAVWLRDMLGCLVVGPFCLVVLTPLAQSLGFVECSKSQRFVDRSWHWGEGIELAGLALGNLLLSLLQVHLHLKLENSAWPLWGISLLLVVWSSIRQGLRGGLITAIAGSWVALSWATFLEVTPAAFSPLQGNLLAQSAVALLVGASVGWIRATEARYRHVVTHIPLVLTSVRLDRGLSISGHGATRKPSSGSKADFKEGAQLLRDAEIVLVSRASKDIFGVEPDRLVGPFSLWLDLVHPDDREIVVASISQLSLQRQTITCEYRIAPAKLDATNGGDARPVEAAAAKPRWVRDTLAPRSTGDGVLDGWESVVEEITEQRVLQQDNRRIAGMLQALIANLPTGVFFVQGPAGQPILVNARARQLLGQREDMAAGIARLSQVYRLHRPDGTDYPVDELPVAKALRHGQTSTANDIVVHRPDGRRVPLFTWAAPIDLGNIGQPEAAVWVLEDLSALQQAEFARRESEARLRAVFETLAEGVVVQNKAGVIIEGNPSAAHILGMPLDQLVGRSWLGPDDGCLRDDGTRYPADQQPDRLAMQIKMPVRNVVVGLPRASGEIRWVLINSMPLPVGTAFAPNTKGAQLVTTFADVTAERQAQRVVIAAKERYQTLVEALPVVVLQLDPAGAVVFMNPAAQEFLGAGLGDFTAPGAFAGLFDDADKPRFGIALQDAGRGHDSRFEFGLQSKAGAAKIGLALVHPFRHDGAAAGSVWIIVDMTRQRRLEEELVKSQRLELVGRLASGTVHDFNNLMMGVIGTTAALKNEIQDRPHLFDDLDRIERTATDASKLLGQILSLGKSPARPAQKLDINPIVLASLSLLKNVIPDNVRVQTQLADEVLTVAADDLQLKQVMLNLCLNARDAMPSGGTMRISTRCDRRHTSDWAVIAVEDTGQGIPEHIREKMYEPFFTTKERGSGIGLSVVRDIVHRLGGTIDVWSETENGTRFEIGFQLVK